jgi:hypothetical protein
MIHSSSLPSAGTLSSWVLLGFSEIADSRLGDPLALDSKGQWVKIND